MLQDNNGTNGRKLNDDAPNVIRFTPRPAEPPPKKNHPPMVNLPPVTKIMLALIIGIRIILFTIGFMNPDLVDTIYTYGGFTPASWSGEIAFRWWTPLTLVTFSFLHGGWLHLAMNALMLAAFGSGLEKWLGPTRLLQVFVVSSACALLAHFLFNMHSVGVVIGISGAISGFFGALLIMMRQQNLLGNARNSLMPFIIIWIITTIGFGMMGAPDGGDIAWVAHLGGFFGGLGFTWWILQPKAFSSR